jgi:hypothetical protein
MSSPSSLFSAASTTSGLDADDDQEDDTKHGIGATQEQTSTPLDGSEQKLAETEASLRGVLSGATRTAPSIPGLYVFPGLLPAGIDRQYFRNYLHDCPYTPPTYLVPSCASSDSV